MLLVGRPEGMSPRRRFVANIKVDLREVWTGLIWLRIGDWWNAHVNTVMDLRAA
jgi:hypothetical protein